MNEQQKIARAIYNAQVASDAGKEIYDLCKNDRKAQKIAHCESYWGEFCPVNRHSRAAAYKAKDTQILLAIELICRSKSKNFRFDVEYGKAPTEYGSKYDSDSDEFVRNKQEVLGYTNCYIVYFDFKINGKREQISFHCFDKRLEKFVKNSRKSTWSRDRSSRETAKDLKRHGASQR